jgi:exodeoxyribonuclease VII small subunit
MGLICPLARRQNERARDSTHPCLCCAAAEAFTATSAQVRAGGTEPKPAVQAQASKIAKLALMPTMPRSSATAVTEPATYEQALAELEALVQAMEAGKMPLDQLLGSYKRGAELLQQCRARLQVVEDQVKLLEDGQLKPWTSA